LCERICRYKPRPLSTGTVWQTITRRCYCGYAALVPVTSSGATRDPPLTAAYPVLHQTIPANGKQPAPTIRPSNKIKIHSRRPILSDGLPQPRGVCRPPGTDYRLTCEEESLEDRDVETASSLWQRQIHRHTGPGCERCNRAVAATRHPRSIAASKKGLGPMVI